MFCENNDVVGVTDLTRVSVLQLSLRTEREAVEVDIQICLSA